MSRFLYPPEASGSHSSVMRLHSYKWIVSGCASQQAQSTFFSAKLDRLNQMALSPGDKLGPYEILSAIGAGGMGEVYKARDIRLGRDVAIKVLPDALPNQTARDRFNRESRAASALNHPNICAIFDVGESEGLPFLVMELLRGETLREQIDRGPMGTESVIELGAQIASALHSAHSLGIIHRDVKPSNIIVTEHGQAKVLDFGLAKHEPPKMAPPGPDGETVSLCTELTGIGTTMGTLAYMSPEQARGDLVDLRTDIWALGVVLYEMAAGMPPFSGASPGAILEAVFTQTPVPLRQLNPNRPPELERIIVKALEKNRDLRYQSMAELRADLTRLGAGIVSASPIALAGKPGERRGLRRFGMTAVATLALVAGGSIWWQLRYRAPIITNRDTVLLGDFVNSTADPVFDGTLRQGLAVQLGQSPFLDLFPDSRTRQTLRLMGKTGDEKVTVDLGREICERQGLKAVITGSIAALGSHYAITLQVTNGHSGEVVALEQAEAERKEQVLKVLGQASTSLRRKLGESLPSIQKFDSQLELTTSSLEALKAYALAYELTQKGRYLESIPMYREATELDPKFAYAWGGLAIQYSNTAQPKLAGVAAGKAFALRDRVSELEKLRISLFYYFLVTGEIDKQIEVLNLHRQLYPRDARAASNLGVVYSAAGQLEKVLPEVKESIRLSPSFSIARGNLVEGLCVLGRFAEATAAGADAVQLKLDNTYLHQWLYSIAFIDNDAPGMQKQIDWAADRPDEYRALDWQAGAAASHGQWRRTQDFSHRATDLALVNGTNEVAARYVAELGLRSAVLGECAPVRALAAKSLAMERNRDTLPRTALSLALCGESASVLSLTDELAKEYPKNTLIRQLWLPVVRAALDLSRGNAAQAIDRLQPASRYEHSNAAPFWPAYLRGEAYRLQKSATAAAAEYRKVLDHRGEDPASVLYPLAHLGLARVTGDAAEYKGFLDLWKNADSDLRPLVEARKESAASGKVP